MVGTFRKTKLAFALSCLLSLGIGVVLGMGIQSGSLSGTALGLEIPAFPGSEPPDVYQINSELAMADAREAKTQADDMLAEVEKLNEDLAEMKNMAFQLRNMLPGSDGYRTIPDSLKTALEKYGIAVQGETSDGGVRVSEADYTNLSDSLKRLTEEATSGLQIKMLEVSKWYERYNDALSLAADFLSKHTKMLEDLARRQ